VLFEAEALSAAKFVEAIVNVEPVQEVYAILE
jgi:hypothetical protein